MAGTARPATRLWLPLFCLLTICAASLARDFDGDEHFNAIPTRSGGSEPAPSCSGANCTVYITSDSANCPNNHPCFSDLSEASEVANSNQVIILLDRYLQLETLAYFDSVYNFTLQSSNVTEIRMSQLSPDIYGPYIVFKNCRYIYIKGIEFRLVTVTDAPLVFDKSSAILEFIVCDRNKHTSSFSYIPAFPSACIYARGESVRISHSTFQANSISMRFAASASSGAAVRMYLGRLYLYNNVFSHNVAVADITYGGAVAALESDLHAVNCTFHSNHIIGFSEAFGGALYSSGGNMELVNCHFGNNSVFSNQAMGLAGGGAIFQSAKPRFPVIISYYTSISTCVFESNSVRGVGDLEGGALSLTSRSVVVHMSNFTFNRLYFDPKMNLMTSRGALVVRGGAIKIAAHSTLVIQNAFVENVATAPGGLSPGWSYGGAAELLVYNFDGLTGPRPSVTLHSNLWLSNRAIGGESSEDTGGGVAIGGAARILGVEAEISVFYNNFTLNAAIGGDSPTNGGSATGGALTINHIKNNMYQTPNASISAQRLEQRQFNKFKANVQSSQRSLVAEVRATILDMDASATTRDIPNARTRRNNLMVGGWNFPSENTQTKQSTQAQQSTQSQQQNSTTDPWLDSVYIFDSSFSQNALYGGSGSTIGGDATGGALYFEGQALQMFGCEFTSNTAVGGDTLAGPVGSNAGGYGKGGAIYIHQNTLKLIMIHTMFVTNVAQGGRGLVAPNRFPPLQIGQGGMAFGGAIAAWTLLPDGFASSISIKNCLFTDNYAIGGESYLNSGDGIGGAVWGSRYSLNSCIFFSNYAASGGAVFAIELMAIHSKFQYNEAKTATPGDALGGAVFCYNASISSSYFANNIAMAVFVDGDAFGGAIHSESLLWVNDTDFYQNSALAIYSSAHGGAIASTNHTILHNCAFRNNSALSVDIEKLHGEGGSIFLHAEYEGSELDNVTVQNSRASFGGGIYVRGHMAHYLLWSNVTVVANKASFAGGGVALLPTYWMGGPIRNLCPTCSIIGNQATDYGDNIVAPYMSIRGNTSSSVNPGLPFQASFRILDFALNTVKSIDVGLQVTFGKEQLFQSGVWQNVQTMDMESGEITFPGMTAWGAPGDPFVLNFSLVFTDSDFGNPGRIVISAPYQLHQCPAGYRLDTTSSYISCQGCLLGMYGFRSNCVSCPNEDWCAEIPESEDSDGNELQFQTDVYRINSGFYPSPHVNPVAIIACPYTLYVDGKRISSCLESECRTDCGDNRILDSTPGFAPVLPNTTCTLTCETDQCETGHRGFLCSQCICNKTECYYHTNSQCAKCLHTYKPTLIVFVVCVFLFILLKGTLLVCSMVILSIAISFLLFFNLISTLLPGIFITAFIIFAEAQRGASSGLIKSFVFYMQTVAIFIVPEALPPQLAKLGSIRLVTQFRVVGLECLSYKLFGNPFQQLLFSMLLPPALLLTLYVAYWLSGLIRFIPFLRAIQDFDPLEHIDFCRSRLRAYAKSDTSYSLLQDSLTSESEVPLSTGDSSFLNDLGGTSKWLTVDGGPGTGTNRTQSWRSFVQFMNWKIGRVALFILFAAHFELCNRVLEVFAPCIQAPAEDFTYSSRYPWVVCSDSHSISFFSPHTIHGQMAITGIIFGVVYIIGVPLLFGLLLFWKRQEIRAGDYATAQWLGLLYNSYRPSRHYFELVWSFRRILFSTAISVVPQTHVSRFLAPTLLILISLLVQRHYKPFISKGDNNMEVFSLLTILFVITNNLVLGWRDEARDAPVWKWINFLLFTTTMLGFMYKFLKPFMLFLRPPPKDE